MKDSATPCSTPTRITMSEWGRGQGGYSVPVRLVIPRIRNYILKIVGLKGTIVILWVVARVKTYIITCEVFNRVGSIALSCHRYLVPHAGIIIMCSFSSVTVYLNQYVN